MSVVSTHSEPLGRKLREGVEIVAGNQDILLNSKEEFQQGAVQGHREDSDTDTDATIYVAEHWIPQYTLICTPSPHAKKIRLRSSKIGKF